MSLREFTVGTKAATLAGATTLVAIRPAAAVSANIGLLRHWAGQYANVTSANWSINFGTQAATLPTLVSATPAKVNFQDAVSVITGGTAAAAGTCGVNASAEGGGTVTDIWDDVMNSVNGYLRVNTPSEVEVLAAGMASCSRFGFTVAPSSLTLWNFGEAFVEL